MNQQQIEIEIKRLKHAIETGDVCNSSEYASVIKEIDILQKKLELKDIITNNNINGK
jgi:hypothetical protein